MGRVEELKEVAKYCEGERKLEKCVKCKYYPRVGRQCVDVFIKDCIEEMEKLEARVRLLGGEEAVIEKLEERIAELEKENESLI